MYWVLLQRVVQQANSARIAGQLKTMATADVASAGWDRERIASQLQPLLSLWQTITSSNSALKAVSHGVSTGFCPQSSRCVRLLS